jgi:hypothetical protein
MVHKVNVYSVMESGNSRPLNIAESRSLDLNPLVAFSGCSADLTSNMFALTITICPDEQGSCVLGLILDIFGNRVLFLPKLLTPVIDSMHGLEAYLCNDGLDRCIK